MDLKRSTSILILLIAIVFTLIIGKKFLLPLVLAGLIWFFVKEIRKLSERIPFIGKRLPRWLHNLVSISVLYGIVGIVVKMLAININELTQEDNLAVYIHNLETINNFIYQQFGISVETFLNNSTDKINYSSLIQGAISSATEQLGNLFMIGLYVLFMLLEETAFTGKLAAMAGNEKKKEEWNNTLKKISDSIGSYLVLKTVVSLLTGVLSYTVLAIIGIDAPLFWAFLIFLLNYIPTVGSLIATLFPACMALLQSSELNLALMVIVAVGAIQLIVGNIIEPRVMGNSLNVSSLVVILALSFWGAIWGITGMVLSVPITVIMVILFGQFESTRKIALLLSDKGKLEL